MSEFRPRRQNVNSATFSHVAGKAQNQSLAYRAFVYKPGEGGMIDLTTMTLDGGLTPASLGWTLTTAVSINDGGVMVGTGLHGGYTKSWIIYPKCVE